MKFSGLLICLSAMALVASVRAGCPITADEVAKIDFNPIKAACGGLIRGANDKSCDSCAAKFIEVFAPIMPKFVTCDEVVEAVESGSNAFDQDITATVSPCIDILMPAMNKANVPILGLLNMRQCPTDEQGPETAKSFEKVFAENCPGYDL